MYQPTPIQKSRWRYGRIIDYWEFVLAALPAEMSEQISSRGFLIEKIPDPHNSQFDRFVIRVPYASAEINEAIYQLQVNTDLTQYGKEPNLPSNNSSTVHFYNWTDPVPSFASELAIRRKPGEIYIPSIPIEYPALVPVQRN